MKERGIIFAAESVRAILAGRKTQTRRVVSKQPSAAMAEGWYPDVYNHGAEWMFWGKAGTPDHNKIGDDLGRCPYGVPGDRLWVREGWAWYWYPDEDGPDIVYRADAGPERPKRWRSPLFMARYQSRLTLEVVAVRVERVQEISLADIDAEGLPPEPWYRVEGGPEKWWRTGWQNINGGRPGCAWADNPWVWVVEFTPASAAGRGEE